MLLIPSIDLRGGHCVRLLQGDFAAETRYDFEPHELLQRYRQLGASWLHVVDLDGARDGALTNRNVIAQLASQRAVRLQVGGGIRTVADVNGMLEAGVARVVIGSVAVEQPETVGGWLRRFGAERVCLAFDVRLDAGGVPRLRTRGWRQSTGVSLWDAVGSFLESGVQHVLCTDIARDGALQGPNVELYAEAVRRQPQIAWQASGGVADAADLAALASVGVASAISGKALLEERITPLELQPYLPNA
jgi:phosphoribosylformimino-5-aminoimidazole carboxamide ribotide isomerase